VRDADTAFSATHAPAVALVGYQSFLKLLLAAVGEKGGGKAGGVDCRTAVRCMCSLLRALPNFNYRTDLLRALIPLLGSEDETVAAATCEAVGRVLSDCGGEAALEAVQLLAEFVKNCECQAPEHTLDVLRSLRFSENLALRLRDDREAGKPMTQKQKNRKWIEERRRLRDEAKTSARSGEADKPAAAPEADEHDFREFEAVPDVAALLQLQTKMLEAVCEIYFRVLKAAIVPNGPSGWPLLKPTLAGLARVSYLIDYEVVTDVLEVLRKLLAQGELSNDLQAALLLTACQVLEGQGAGLVAVDFRDFHRHLYRLAACSPSMEASRLWSSAAAAGSVGERGQQASKLWVRTSRPRLHLALTAPCRSAQCPPCCWRGRIARLTRSVSPPLRSAWPRCAPLRPRGPSILLTLSRSPFTLRLVRCWAPWPSSVSLYADTRACAACWCAARIPFLNII